MAFNILIVDDDRELVRQVAHYLEQRGCNPVPAYDGNEGYRLVRKRDIDLVILDWMLTGLDGPTFCRRLRRESEIPIILLSSKTEEEEMIKGLNLGADDYVTKPFSPEELMARVEAVLRRVDGKKEPEEIVRGSLTLNLKRHEIFQNGRTVELTNTEYEIIRALMEQPGRIFSRGQLLDAVQEESFFGSRRTIDVHITNLRKKIEPDPATPIFIHTVYGAGYKFECKSDDSRKTISAKDQSES